MAEVSPLGRLHDLAVASLVRDLAERQPTVARPRRNDETRAWTVAADLREADVETLVVAVDRAFPFSWPRFYLPDASNYLRWPHVEHDGRLCIRAGTDSPSCSVEAGFGCRELQRAENLVRECASGANRDDFLAEFDSYWAPGAAAEILLLVDPATASRRLVSATIGSRLVVAEDEAALRRWLRGFGTAGDRLEVRTAVFARLRTPLYPPHPSTVADLIEVAGAYSNDAPALLSQLANNAGPCAVLMSFEGLHGGILAGCIVATSSDARKAMCRGYRRHKLRLEVVRQRVGRAGLGIERVRVQRVDPGWLHHRGGRLGLHRRVAGKVVALIGCGSLGAPVALALAQAGVGGMILFDPDNLAWNNVARHPLGGGAALGRNKAAALRHEIMRRFPHIDVTAEDKPWQAVYAARPDLLGSADLVISTTGDWGCDAALALLSRTRFEPPVLFGWAEAHAIAGHALLSKPIGGCLRCGMTSAGRFVGEVTDWTTDPELQEPSCGAFFTPMGASDLMPIASMITELALEELRGECDRSLHRVWLGSSARLAELGGAWNDCALHRYGEPGEGRRMHSATWRPEPDCRFCTGQPVSRAA